MSIFVNSKGEFCTTKIIENYPKNKRNGEGDGWNKIIFNDNRDNNSVTPTLYHGKEYEATKFCTTKIVENYQKNKRNGEGDGWNELLEDNERQYRYQFSSIQGVYFI